MDQLLQALFGCWEERLVKAIKGGNVKNCEEAISHLQDVNFVLRGGTPLHYAADKGRLDIVDLLIEAGADVNLTTDDFNENFYEMCGFAYDFSKKTAEEIANIRGFYKIEKLLKDLSNAAQSYIDVTVDEFRIVVPIGEGPPEPVPPQLPEDVMEWGNSDVLYWISGLSAALKPYKTEFKKRGIKGKDLWEMSQEVLQNIVPNVDHADEVWNSIRSLRAKQTLLAEEKEDDTPKASLDTKFYYSVQKCRGCALVIGNGNAGKIQSSCHKDAAAMHGVLIKIGYRVHDFEDISGDDILKHTRAIARLDHSMYDSFVLYFSGHGGKNVIYGADGLTDTVRIKEIVRLFDDEDCSSLRGKPKIFLWDCCRGSQQMSKAFSDNEDEFQYPQYQDFVYAYSTAPKFEAYVGREETGGLSIWTYYLHKLFRDPKKHHLANILTIVQNCVSEHIVAYGRKKMTANHISTLTKFVFVK